MERGSSALSAPTSEKRPVWTTFEARSIATCLQRHPLLEVREQPVLAMGIHKQDVRFQQLQQTRRRTVEFWSLLDFCAKSNWVCEVGYVLIMISRFPTNLQINTWICGFMCCLSILFHLSQPHFPLSPTPRKEIIIFPGTLRHLWVTDISVQWSRNLGAVKFYMNTKFVPHRNPKYHWSW